MAKRPEVLHDSRTIIYNQSHWSNFHVLRSRALDIMKKLEGIGIRPLLHGSVARGDVAPSSDIDIIILQQVSSYKIELALGHYIMRELVQATPSMVLKGHIYLEGEIVVSFPIFKTLTREEEFYRWGGVIDSVSIEAEMRVPGVDKRLLLIEPIPAGHVESGVIENEYAVAKKLDVSIDIARERVRVLTRRDIVGKTGVYINYKLKDTESFEEVAKRLQDSDPALRRTIERRQGKRR
ncbi:nucleotidyltransferase [Candidatus Thorarchaeota archaeon]|nr:MAG: nucleotidyltransferase [Candidatus Thorarchaeota archaeon]